MKSNAFYVSVSALLFLVAVAGFAPTFVLRPLFGLAPLPWQVCLHGGVMTVWFGLLATQAVLIGRGHKTLHRKLGYASIVLAIAVVAVSLVTLQRFVARSEFPQFNAAVLRANLTTLTAFVLCYGSALALRRRTEWHRRLMLFTGIAVIGPGFDRISRWPVFAPSMEQLFAGWPMPFSLAFAAVAVSIFLIATVAHDLYATRRVQWATAVGLLYLLLVAQVGGRVAASLLT